MVEPTAPTPAGSHLPPLAGRAYEQAVLRDCLDAALAGRGNLALIGGEAGIGKTALAETLCAEATSQDALALVGRCYDLSETPPYGPWLDLCGRYQPVAGLPALPSALATRRAIGEIASQAALFTQIHGFFAAVALQRPVVVLLEDLHWADQASLDLLRFLARHMAMQRVLLVVTYRSDDLTRRHPLYQVLPVLVREADATRLDLRRLDGDATRALVGARYSLPVADQARLVAYLTGHAEGNPFYMGELLRTLEEDRVLRRVSAGGRDAVWVVGDLAQLRIPPLLGQVIDGRLARLGKEARALLGLAAVIGQEVPLALWATVSGAPEDALAAVVERAAEAHILEEAAAGDGLRFVHALVRDALYAGIALPRRRGWHRAIGAVLAAAPDPDPDAVADHFRRAGDARAPAWFIRAGERAQRAYAWLTAAQRYEAALALLGGSSADARERAELLITLAHLRRYADPHGGIAHLARAERLANAAGDATLAAAARFDQGHLRCLAGDLGRGVGQMADALPSLAALAPAERARLPTLRVLGVAPDEDYHRGALVFHLASVGRFAEARTIGEPFVGHGPGTTARGLVGLGQAYAARGEPDEARRAFADARAAYRAAGQHYEVAATVGYELALVALRYGPDRLAERQRLAAEKAHAEASAAGVWDSVLPRSVPLPLLLLDGRWAEAHRSLLAALAAGYDDGEDCGYLGALARERGEPDLAWRLVRAALPAGAATTPGEAPFLASLALQRLAAALALDAGDLAAARAWLATHDRWLAWNGVVLGRAEGHLGWAAYHRAAGNPIQAQEHAALALAAASEPRQPLALLAAHRLLGELATEAGQHGDAASHVDEALALADACAAPYERALTLLALAESRAATGNAAEARVLLGDIRTICIPLDAKPALARADALAARLADKAAPRRAYPAGLSAREVDVLRLVAQGLTDSQVAGRLFLSPFTVKAHLRSIYGKLGVTSRSAATRFALEQHLA